eukprot:4606754-Prymnesium_polylepis.1
MWSVRCGWARRPSSGGERGGSKRGRLAWRRAQSHPIVKGAIERQMVGIDDDERDAAGEQRLGKLGRQRVVAASHDTKLRRALRRGGAAWHGGVCEQGVTWCTVARVSRARAAPTHHLTQELHRVELGRVLEASTFRLVVAILAAIAAGAAQRRAVANRIRIHGDADVGSRNRCVRLRPQMLPDAVADSRRRPLDIGLWDVPIEKHVLRLGRGGSGEHGCVCLVGRRRGGGETRVRGHHDAPRLVARAKVTVKVHEPCRAKRAPHVTALVGAECRDEDAPLAQRLLQIERAPIEQCQRHVPRLVLPARFQPSRVALVGRVRQHALVDVDAEVHDCPRSARVAAAVAVGRAEVRVQPVRHRPRVIVPRRLRQVLVPKRRRDKHGILAGQARSVCRREVRRALPVLGGDRRRVGERQDGRRCQHTSQRHSVLAMAARGASENGNFLQRRR